VWKDSSSMPQSGSERRLIMSGRSLYMALSFVGYKILHEIQNYEWLLELRQISCSLKVTFFPPPHTKLLTESISFLKQAVHSQPIPPGATWLKLRSWQQLQPSLSALDAVSLQPCHLPAQKHSGRKHTEQYNSRNCLSTCWKRPNPNSLSQFL